MSDKQVFAAIIGGFISAVTGGLLAVPVTLLAHTDGGDDGWGIVWWGFMIVFGITGFAFAARWARKHVSLNRWKLPVLPLVSSTGKGSFDCED